MAAANHAPADRKSITKNKFKMTSKYFILQFPVKLETFHSLITPSPTKFDAKIAQLFVC
jgi:hypothetical protein